MSFSERYIKVVQKLLPSPFTIAVGLTVLTFIFALIFTQAPDQNIWEYGLSVAGYWQKGFWELLAFTMQMALILLLGHTLALSPLINRLIEKITFYCKDTARAAYLISFTTILLSFLNWGLCVVYGAILARKVGEKAKKSGMKLNYALIGAAGYCGMMTWHGGLSGSAPLKVAEPGHFLVDVMGQIPISATLFSAMNITVALSLLLVIPIVFYLIGKLTPSATMPELEVLATRTEPEDKGKGAERVEHSHWAAWIMGGIMLGLCCWLGWRNGSEGKNFINLNYINFFLFGAAILAHGTLFHFQAAVQKAVSGITGILIQFPLYAGIMGIMKYSGLVAVMSQFFVGISTPSTFPILTFMSAAIVNTFVPSGGGQWAVQGPIIANAAKVLHVAYAKAVMALAYGDQLSNMLQPFWALPLLGITRLKAKDILPYSLVIMLVGAVLMMLGLWFF